MSAVIRLAAAVVRGVCDEDGPKAEAMRELAIDARREHDAAIAERDRLRFDVQQLRDRLRRGEDIRPEQVAEMLGDMLEEP